MISQFNSPDKRNDLGALFENFVILERLKKRMYQNIYLNSFFWRTYHQQEIDYIEESAGRHDAYEIKWSTSKQIKVPREWDRAYPQAGFHTVTPETYLDFIL